MNRCRHCHRLAARLRALYGHSMVYENALVRPVWQKYWRDQERRQQRAALLPNQRWCSTGHVVTVATFHPFPRARGSGYCHDCHAIYQLRYRHRQRHGEWLSWEEVSARHFRAPHRSSKRRNAKAPKGQRWCAACQSYYTIPATWTQKKGHTLWRCPPCSAVYFQARAAHRKHRRQGVAQDG